MWFGVPLSSSRSSCGSLAKKPHFLLRVDGDEVDRGADVNLTEEGGKESWGSAKKAHQMPNFSVDTRGTKDGGSPLQDPGEGALP